MFPYAGVWLRAKSRAWNPADHPTGLGHDRTCPFQHAVNAVQAGSSMVSLLLERVDQGAEERVGSYYAIYPTVVVRNDIPNKSLQRGVLRAPPAWLLAKLALDRSLRTRQGPPVGRPPPSGGTVDSDASGNHSTVLAFLAVLVSR